MNAFLWGYGLGFATPSAALIVLYIKGFFKEWVKTPVITIEPKVDVGGEAKL